MMKLNTEQLKNEAKEIDYDFMVDMMARRELSAEQKENLEKYKSLNTKLDTLVAE